MKNTFKISALALVVAVGLTACKSGSSASDPNIDTNKKTQITKPAKPTPPAKPAEPKKPTPPAKPAEPAKPTPPAKPAEPAKPTPPAKPAEPAKPTPPAKPAEPAKPTPPVKPAEPAKPTPPAKPAEPAKPTPPAKPAEPPKPQKVVSVDSEGKKWRVVGIGGEYRGESYNKDADYFNVDGSYLNEKYSSHSNNQCDRRTCKGDVITNGNNINQKVRLNLDELAQKDGKPLVGTYKGSIQQEFLAGKVVDAYFDENGKLMTSSAETDKVNYLFTNQPYSSYGAVFTNQNDIRLFYLTQDAGLQGEGYEYEVYKKHLHQGVDTGRLVWKDSVKGGATYKGEAIAAVQTYHPEKFDELQHKPVVDGTVTLNANFGETWDNTYVSGELNSKSIGKIALPKDTFDYSLQAYSNIEHQIDESGKKFSGHYVAQFGGKDLNDVVGYIKLSNYADKQYLNDGEVREYKAVFGATKQPK